MKKIIEEVVKTEKNKRNNKKNQLKKTVAKTNPLNSGDCRPTSKTWIQTFTDSKDKA